jgi:hypothetical protein
MADRPLPVVPVAAADPGVISEDPTTDVPEGEAIPYGRAVERTRRSGHRLWRLLRVHLAVFALALISLAPFMRVNTAWTVDEGLYSYQVRALQQGDWKIDYWAAPIDPDGRWFPLKRHEKGRDSYFPYVKSPAYPLLMWAATRVVGDSIGLHLFPILGALGAAAAAWLLASLVDRRAAPFAFWIAALGPVVINAYVIWAHAPSAAVAGLTAYAATRALRGGITATRVAGLCIGIASGVLLRSEGLLFAAALAAALGALGALRLLARAPNAARAVWLAATAGTTALTVNALEHRWVVSIVGHIFSNDYVRNDGLPYWEGKILGARHILLDVSYLETGTLLTIVELVMTVVVTVATARALSRSEFRAHVVASVAMFMVAALLVVRFLGPSDTVPGIIPAWPIAIIGLILFKWRLANQVERVLAGVIVLELLATLATQYPEGGGFEWGARYLSPLYPLIAALAALALYRTIQGSSISARRHLVPLMVLLTLIPAAGGLRAQTSLRSKVDQWIQIVEGAPGVVITTDEWLAQGAFRTYPAHEWLHVQSPEIPTALTRLGEAGYKDVIVLEPLSAWSTETLHPPGGYRVRRDLGPAVYLTHS